PPGLAVKGAQKRLSTPRAACAPRRRERRLVEEGAQAIACDHRLFAPYPTFGHALLEPANFLRHVPQEPTWVGVCQRVTELDGERQQRSRGSQELAHAG